MRNRMENTAEKISETVEKVAETAAMEVVDVRCSGGKISVFIDKPGGVTVAECAEISREIGVLIDIEQAAISPCTLEVSSPGPERPLKKISDYERFDGRRAKIKMKSPIGGCSVFTGRISGASGGFVRLSQEDSDAVLSVPFDGIQSANLKREIN